MRTIDADALKAELIQQFTPTVCKGLRPQAMLNQIVLDIDAQPTVDAIPISAIKRGIQGFGAEMQCGQGGCYSVEMYNALKRVLEWYGSPDYKQTEAVACCKTVVNQYGKENYHIDHVDDLFL